MLEDYESDQKQAVMFVKKMIENHKISHAYIIEANEYSKAFDFALSFAKAILCPFNYFNNKQCKECRQCEKIENGVSLEVKIITPEDVWIKKQQLDELQKDFNKTSINGNKKIYIVNRAEKLNASSSNSMLKFLEDPPEKVIAILVADKSANLLSTIVSRCQVVLLKNNEGNQLKSLEKTYSFDDYQEKIKNAIEFLNKIEQDIEKTYITIKKEFFNLFSDREQILFCLDVMLLFYIEALNEKCNIKNNQFNKFQEIKEKFLAQNSISSISKKIKIIEKTKRVVEQNTNLSLSIDKFFIEMRSKND